MFWILCAVPVTAILSWLYLLDCRDPKAAEFRRRNSRVAKPTEHAVRRSVHLASVADTSIQ